MNAAIPRASRKTSRAEWLLWLEREDDRISRVLHQVTRKRQRYQEQAQSLRMALTVEDRALYDTLRSMRTTVERRADVIAGCAKQRSGA